MRSIYQRFTCSSGDEGQPCSFSKVPQQKKLRCSLLLIIVNFITTDIYAVSLMPRVKQADSYLSHSCTLFQTDPLSCWGDSVSINSANGSMENSTVPVESLRSEGDGRPHDAKEIKREASASTCVFKKGDEDVCWVPNESGEPGYSKKDGTVFSEPGTD